MLQGFQVGFHRSVCRCAGTCWQRLCRHDMACLHEAINVLQILVIALGAGLGVWGVINLLEGYGNDNPAPMLGHKETPRD